MIKNILFALIIIAKAVNPVAAQAHASFAHKATEISSDYALTLLRETTEEMYKMCPNRTTMAIEDSIGSTIAIFQTVQMFKEVAENAIGAAGSVILEAAVSGATSSLLPGKSISEKAAEAALEEMGCDKDDRTAFETGVGEGLDATTHAVIKVKDKAVKVIKKEAPKSAKTVLKADNDLIDSIINPNHNKGNTFKVTIKVNGGDKVWVHHNVKAKKRSQAALDWKHHQSHKHHGSHWHKDHAANGSEVYSVKYTEVFHNHRTHYNILVENE